MRGLDCTHIQSNKGAFFSCCFLQASRKTLYPPQKDPDYILFDPYLACYPIGSEGVPVFMRHQQIWREFQGTSRCITLALPKWGFNKVGGPPFRGSANDEDDAYLVLLGNLLNPKSKTLNPNPQTPKPWNPEASNPKTRNLKPKCP